MTKSKKYDIIYTQDKKGTAQQMPKRNRKMRIEVNEKNFTAEELKAFTTCHNAYFYAMMCDRVADQEREERAALKKLQEVMPNVIAFYPNYNNGENDVVVLANN